MIGFRAGACLAGAGFLTLAYAGTAVAGTGTGQLLVNPSSAAPGQGVRILGTCPNNGGRFTSVTSAAFAGGSAHLSNADPKDFTGTAVVGRVAAGNYDVTAHCGGADISVNLSVSDKGVAMRTVQPTVTAMPTAHPTAQGGTPLRPKAASPTGIPPAATMSAAATPASQVSVTPLGAADTGRGATDSSGDGNLALAVGGGVIALGAAVAALRRRARVRGPRD